MTYFFLWGVMQTLFFYPTGDGQLDNLDNSSVVHNLLANFVLNKTHLYLNLPNESTRTPHGHHTDTKIPNNTWTTQ